MFPSTGALRIRAILLLLVVVGPTRADEAVYRNGRRLSGKLQLDADGRLRFAAQDGKSNLNFADIQDVRFPELVPHSSLWGAPLRIGFGNEEWVTGELQGLTEKSAAVRTFSSENVAVPRAGLVAVTQLPGWLTIFHEDFDADKARLKLTHAPTLDESEHTSGRRSLRLDAAGQSAVYTLPTQLKAGRFGVNFCELGQATNGQWIVEAEFGDKQSVRIVLGGGADYAVETDLESAGTRRLTRSPGWHRLGIRFRADHMLIGVDGKLLFESSKTFRSKGLRTVRLICLPKLGTEAMRGAVCFDDFCIARPLEELHHDSGDPAQDECWLADGDQLFGQVSHVGGRGVEIQGRFGKRTLPWSSLRGFFPRSATIEPKISDGAHVRVWLDSGFPEADELEGLLIALNDSKLALRHPLLGDLTLDRTRLRKLRPLFFGKRIELDNKRHHLGETGRLVPGLFPARAEGPTLRCVLQLETVPPSARLVATVHHLGGEANGNGAELKRGELGTEVLINGRSLGSMNRYVDRAVKEPVRVVITIPADALKASENKMELIQTPESKSGRRASCVISGLTVELPR